MFDLLIMVSFEEVRNRDKFLTLGVRKVVRRVVSSKKGLWDLSIVVSLEVRNRDKFLTLGTLKVVRKVVSSKKGCLGEEERKHGKE